MRTRLAGALFLVASAQRFLNLAPGLAVLVYQPNVSGLPDGWQGGASVRSLDGKRLVAVVNADRPEPDAAPADWLLSYTGFPQ